MKRNLNSLNRDRKWCEWTKNLALSTNITVLGGRRYFLSLTFCSSMVYI